jgi:hypothetical protein
VARHGDFMKWFFPWLLVTSMAFGDSPAPVALQVATASHLHTEYLILLFSNAPGWHTYYKHPGEVGLPFQFSFARRGVPAAMALTGWPTPETFIDPTGFTSKGYTGQYAFFFFLPAAFPAMGEGELVHIEAKWLACGDRCIPQKVALDVLWQHGRWVPAEKNREISLKPDQVVQFFSSLESGSAEILGEFQVNRDSESSFWVWFLAVVGVGGLFGWRRFRSSSKQ